MPPWTTVLWSLSTEVQFYRLLPLLPLALRSRRSRRIALVVFALYTAAYVYLQTAPLSLHWAHVVRIGNSVFGRAWLFLAGIAAAWIHLHHDVRVRSALAARALVRNGGADVALLAVLAAFGLVLRWMTGFRGMKAEYPPTMAWHVIEALAWMLVLLAVLLAPLRLKPLVSNPVLARLGLLSYSIYLWHVPILRTLLGVLYPHIPAMGTTVAVVLPTAIVLVVSALSYRYIEQPFLVRKARLEA
jgi:peptidoglycan/LPS O-acetylase OafA/YrhL